MLLHMFAMRVSCFGHVAFVMTFSFESRRLDSELGALDHLRYQMTCNCHIRDLEPPRQSHMLLTRQSKCSAEEYSVTHVRVLARPGARYVTNTLHHNLATQRP